MLQGDDRPRSGGLLEYWNTACHYEPGYSVTRLTVQARIELLELAIDKKIG